MPASVAGNRSGAGERIWTAGLGPVGRDRQTLAERFRIGQKSRTDSRPSSPTDPTGSTQIRNLTTITGILTGSEAKRAAGQDWGSGDSGRGKSSSGKLNRQCCEVRKLVYGILADLVVFLHFSYAVFAVGGGLLCLRWKIFLLIHPVAAAWAVFVELAGRTCPLTPLENTLREKGGEIVYSGDFVEHYLTPILYPEGLTRTVQIFLGTTVLAVNLVIYYSVYRKWRREKR